MTRDLFGGSGGSKPSCHTTHKELKFGKGILVGAKCGSPRPGFDIYIGFDWGMEYKHDVYPWQVKKDPVIEFQFRIPDMGVPKSHAQFKKMITWVCSQLHAGKRIHVGCIGGHGRTGMFIAAVRAEFDGDKNATIWTRKHHCKKAVESKSQINFLFKHYGIKKVKPTKSDYKGWVEKPYKPGQFNQYLGTGVGNQSKKAGKVLPFKTPASMKIKHIKGKGSIWG